MEIIDGQHRLAAAKMLGVPIYYCVNEDAEDEDIVLLNENQNIWKKEEYLHFFSKKNVPAYRQLDEFLEKNKITLRIFLMIRTNNSKNFAKSFRTGQMKPIQREEYDNILAIYHQIHELIEFLKERRSDSWKVFNSSYFFQSLAMFLPRQDVDYQELKDKLEIKIDAIGPRSGVGGYYQMLVQIYNFRKRDAIPYEEEGEKNDLFDKMPPITPPPIPIKKTDLLDKFKTLSSRM